MRGFLLMLLLLASQAQAQTGLVVTAQAGQLTLSWTDNSTMETAFLVERSLPNDICEFVQVTSLPADTEGFVDTPLTEGARWCYRVRAANDAGVSPPSNVACGTVVNAAPTTASATFVKDAAHPGPYRVPVGAYVCERTVGGAARARIYQGTALLKDAALPNPLVGVPFMLTCELTPTSVLLTVNDVLKLTASR